MANFMDKFLNKRFIYINSDCSSSGKSGAKPGNDDIDDAINDHNTDLLAHANLIGKINLILATL